MNSKFLVGKNRMRNSFLPLCSLILLLIATVVTIIIWTSLLPYAQPLNFQGP
jgi:hypothetical protein